MVLATGVVATDIDPENARPLPNASRNAWPRLSFPENCCPVSRWTKAMSLPYDVFRTPVREAIRDLAMGLLRSARTAAP